MNILILLLVVFLPFVEAWGLNVIFGLAIPIWSFKTWMAMVVIGAFIRPSVPTTTIEKYLTKKGT